MLRLSIYQMLLVIVLCLIATEVFTITCEIGYGQRGKRYSNQISWIRTCPGVLYCFEAVTTDIKKMQHLIDYPWVSFVFSDSFSLGLNVI
jgi:sulfite reductase beta subunit-like hemoprotein